MNRLDRARSKNIIDTRQHIEFQIIIFVFVLVCFLLLFFCFIYKTDTTQWLRKYKADQQKGNIHMQRSLYLSRSRSLLLFFLQLAVSWKFDERQINDSTLFSLIIIISPNCVGFDFFYSLLDAIKISNSTNRWMHNKKFISFYCFIFRGFYWFYLFVK